MICNFFRGWIICFWLNFDFFSRWTTAMTYIFSTKWTQKRRKKYKICPQDIYDFENWYVCFDCSTMYVQKTSFFLSAILQNKRKKKRNQYIQICQQQNMLDNHHPPPFNLIFKGVIHQQCSLVWPQLWSFKELNWLCNL